MKAVAVDEGHLHGLRAVPELVELAGRTNRAPEAGEAASSTRILLTLMMHLPAVAENNPREADYRAGRYSRASPFA